MKTRFPWLRILVHLLGLLPLVRIGLDAWTGGLSINPIQDIEQRLGRAALYFLVATLAVTPLTSLTGWKSLPQRRRALGLYTFLYAGLHFFTFAVIDYGFHVIAIDLPDERLVEMRELIDDGIPSFKLLMAYPGRVMVDDGVIYRAMRVVADAGGMILVHAENGHVIEAIIHEARAAGQTAPKYHAVTRPAATEAEAVRRAIDIAEMTGCPVYIVHLSSAAGLARIVEARRRGLPVYAETCPQYLFLDDSRYQDGIEGAKYVMSPPLRKREDQEALWGALASGDLQLVATDHCPFTLAQKAAGLHDFSKIPNGGPAVEHRMSLLYHGGVAGGRFDMRRFVEVTSTAAAKMFGLYPRKGTIAVGSDADLVIFDGDAEATISAATHHMRVDYSAYEGMRVRGVVETVIARGRVIVENGRFTGKPGDGQFLKRDRFAM